MKEKVLPFSGSKKLKSIYRFEDCKRDQYRCHTMGPLDDKEQLGSEFQVDYRPCYSRFFNFLTEKVLLLTSKILHNETHYAR